jgi:hypothetical protein
MHNQPAAKLVFFPLLILGLCLTVVEMFHHVSTWVIGTGVSASALSNLWHGYIFLGAPLAALAAYIAWKDEDSAKVTEVVLARWIVIIGTVILPLVSASR